MKALAVVMFALLSLPLSSFSQRQVLNERYVDAVTGKDRNDGKSPERPWKTLDKVNAQTYGPGARILFRAGQAWKGQLHPKGSGSGDAPIVISRYGEGARPLIDGGGSEAAIFLENQSGWRIEHLEVTNFDETEEGTNLSKWENHNRTYWAEAPGVLPRYRIKRRLKNAILVKAYDAGVVSNLHFKDLEIHGVNGDITDKNNGGIFLQISGDKTPTYFDDLLVEGCHIHDVDRTGISNMSSWENRTRADDGNWTPSRRVVIRGNVFERTGANALIVRVAQDPLVERNLFDHCAIKESGNANFPFNCDGALFQYNESRFTQYNSGDADAGGFDSDYRCKNTVIQYNYSHHNEFGGVLICCMGADTVARFNDGTIVRYNIFEDNGGHTFRVAGTPTHSDVYGNIVLLNAARDSSQLIWHKSWRGFGHDTRYHHNLVYNQAQHVRVDLGKSTGNFFYKNWVLGTPIDGLPGASVDHGNTAMPDQFKMLEEIDHLHGAWEKVAPKADTIISK